MHGGDRKSTDAKSSSLNANLIDSSKTCDRIAEENGVSRASVLRASHYTRGIDIADNRSPGIKQKVLRLAGSLHGTVRKANGHLSGRRPLHLANARPFRCLKAPLGLSLLRCANASLPWQAEQAHHTPSKKTERSRRGTPCCTYCYRMWILAGCVLCRGAPCFFTMIHHFPRAASGILHQHESGSDAAHPGFVPIFCAGMPCKRARKQCHFPAYCPILSA